MSRNIELDVSDFRRFFARLKSAANGDFRKELTNFVEGLGNEFLRVLQDEIIRRQVMDSRLLLASFEKGGQDNVWLLTDGDLSLEVGTNVKYAKWVNDGHKANPDGVASRFIPGKWVGDRFIYDPSAKEGMVLKQQFIRGKPYWDSALRIIERMYPNLLEAKLQQWLDTYFAEFR